MIILVGESASGKSTLQNAIIEKLGYKRLVSYTTRPPRDYEKDGIDYNFISKAMYIHMKENGFFAETAEYNGWFYGTAKEDYDSNVVAVLTPHGLRQVKKILDSENIISIYLKVPRRDRLIKILQRGDNIEEAYRRNLSDVGQFDGIEDEVDYVIENPNYSKTANEIVNSILENTDITKNN